MSPSLAGVLAFVAGLALVSDTSTPRVLSTGDSIGAAGHATRIHGLARWSGTVRLEGDVWLADSATLTIAPGTRIEAATGARLVVGRTSRILAVGTLLQPIVFTCANAAAAPGCWDGIVIAGHAPLNGGTPTSPSGGRGATGGCRERVGADGPFGGCFVQDSSGVLRYVRIERSTAGLQLLGVGDRTVIADVQVHQSVGSGIEIVGGTVGLRRVVLTSNVQWGLRWAAGWTGRAQQVIVQQDANASAGGILGQNAASTGEDPNAEPKSAPRLSHLTVLAPTGATNPFGTVEPAALRFERGTAGRLENVVLVRPAIAVDVDDLATCAQVAAGTLALRAVVVLEPIQLTDPDADAAGCSAANGDDQLLVAANYLLLDAPGAIAAEMLSAQDLFLPDLRPRFGGSVATLSPSFALADAFIASLPFVGAVDPAAAARNNIPWYSGWTSGGVAAAPALTSVFVRAVSVGRGGLSNARVRLRPSGQSVVTGTEGGALLVSVPAGATEIEVTPSDPSCAPASIRTTLRAGQSNDAVVRVACSTTPPAVSLALGDLHTCRRTTAAGTECWGRNTRGQLGDGTQETRDLPAPVAGGAAFVALAAGSAHTCALDATGTASCWGENSGGQLGDGGYAVRTTPQPVSTSTRFVQLAAAGSHSCGLTADGSAWCWGSNGNGELGDGSLITRPLPVPVTGGRRYFWIAAGAQHTCAVATTGGTYCWGDNAAGQLGDGTTLDRSQPTLVSGGSPFVTLAGGLVHSCGTTADGSLLCWGSNASGQLATGVTGGIQAVPVAAWAPIGTRHVATAAGGQHSCALRVTGVATCAGRGDAGQLGAGDGLDATLLVPATLPASAVTIGTGLSHSCANDALERTWCWGSNLDGQLGLGTRIAAYTPQLVGGGTVPPSASGFSLEFVFDASVPQSVRTVLESAAAKWSSVIVGDVPDVNVFLPASTCVGSSIASGTYSIDDVRVVVRVTPIDGLGGQLGRAGPCYYRSGGPNGAPAVGTFTLLGGVELDVADIASLEANDALSPLALHELGHVLGLGTFWSALDLVLNPATAPVCDQPGRDTRYRGIGAVARYTQMTGLAGRDVPVEAGGGCATANVHWRETVFSQEVMTGYLSAGPAPLSRVTVGALEDLGFLVSEAGADAYAVPNPALVAGDATARQRLIEGRVDPPIPIRRIPGTNGRWRVVR